MVQTTKLRGRPKGTGINDEEQIRKIALLIHGDSSLKPTTAIRNLGHTNPSVIRRLRDKFNVHRDGLFQAIAREQINTRKCQDTLSRIPTVPAVTPASMPGAGSSAIDVNRDLANRRAKQDYTMPWFGIATQCAVVVANQQVTAAREMARHPSTSYALQQQFLLSQMMWALCSVSKSSSSRHLARS